MQVHWWFVENYREPWVLKTFISCSYTTQWRREITVVSYSSRHIDAQVSERKTSIWLTLNLLYFVWKHKKIIQGFIYLTIINYLWWSHLTTDRTHEECTFENSITYEIGFGLTPPGYSSLAHLFGIKGGKKESLCISSCHMACMCTYIQKLITKKIVF